MQPYSFHGDSLDALREQLAALGVSLPLSEETGVLREPLRLQRWNIPNRIAIQPMEGCDGLPSGAPGELTERRYRRFAESGAGLIWFEAVAIQPDARANPRQLMLTEETLADFAALVKQIRTLCRARYGFEPILIMQATHSGRYSKPEGTPAPRIAYPNPLFEKEHPLPADCVLSDGELDELPARYAKAAVLAQQAGFDGIDIKACHRYLLSELLSAYERPGRYGGSFENRTRLLRDAVAAARAAAPDLLVTSRLNLYDGFPRPYGWGCAADGLEPDMTEPIRLLQELALPLADLTVGNPYVNPHVNRPFDRGPYTPPEHPLCGVARICRCVGEVKQALPQLTVIGSGFSYLRQFSGALAAGMVQQGLADLAGFGREAFAYPQFAADLLYGSGMKHGSCCIACGCCSELMRAGTVAGCVVRDSDVYSEYYKKFVLQKG